MKLDSVEHGPGGDSSSVPQNFALDTDIGSDVDDILALATIQGSEELLLDLVTTVYGDVDLRARMVARFFSVSGGKRPVVVPGLSETRSGRAVWWPGHEGALMQGLPSEKINDDLDAIALLAKSSTVTAIAPLTNIAAALESSGSDIQEVYMMAGEFEEGRIEHNIKCDVEAAATVFENSVPVTVVGLDQTERVRLHASELKKIESSGPLGELLAAEMHQFWAFTNESSNVPHDPIAVLMMTSPELFQFARGRVTVVRSGPVEGRTRFDPDPHGPHRVVTAIHASAADQIVARILRATTQAVSPDR